MTPADLQELDELLGLAGRVVPLRVAPVAPTEVQLRHDVDDNPGALDAAVRLAAWESARGYASTFFILHTARYWREPHTRARLEQIACLGHEIGIHANAITAALYSGRTPAAELCDALETLASWGHDVVGVAPHGDDACYGPGRVLRFVNDEIFTECARPELGPASRVVHALGREVRLDPRPLADYGLTYEAYRLPRGAYLSDSGNTWAPAIATTRAAFEAGLDAPLQVLVHPDWYTQAL